MEKKTKLGTSSAIVTCVPRPCTGHKAKMKIFAQAGASTAVINQAIIRDLSAGAKYIFQGFNPLRNLWMENLPGRKFVRTVTLWKMNAFKKRNFAQAMIMTSLCIASHLQDFLLSISEFIQVFSHHLTTPFSR